MKLVSRWSQPVLPKVNSHITKAKAKTKAKT